MTNLAKVKMAGAGNLRLSVRLFMAPSMCKRLNMVAFFVLFIILTGCGELTVKNALEDYNEGSVPYISVEEMKGFQPEYILDTREKEEYEVSHLPGSIWVGFDSFSIDQITTLISEKDKSIVVYCSVGIRSEDIGEKLMEHNYSNVKNLYGGIFEWKNQGGQVIDSTGRQTQNVHAYSKFWGRLLTEANKVY